MNYFRELAEKANKAANSAEAKAIRDKIFKVSIPVSIIGGIGVLVSFISFAAMGMSLNMGGILIPFIGFIISGMLLGFGTLGIKVGLSIVVAQAGTKLADTNHYCPTCKDRIDENEKFCGKCGSPLLQNKICKKCHTQNDIQDKYCKECGNQL